MIRYLSSNFTDFIILNKALIAVVLPSPVLPIKIIT